MGLFDLKKPKEYPYLVAEESGEGEVRRGRPPAGLIRRETGFKGLPEGAGRRVLEVCRGLWGLQGEPSGRYAPRRTGHNGIGVIRGSGQEECDGCQP
jgi:hypothetical protein